jgi:hypothetical protein
MVKVYVRMRSEYREVLLRERAVGVDYLLQLLAPATLSKHRLDSRSHEGGPGQVTLARRLVKFGESLRLNLYDYSLHHFVNDTNLTQGPSLPSRAGKAKIPVAGVFVLRLPGVSRPLPARAGVPVVLVVIACNPGCAYNE